MLKYNVVITVDATVKTADVLKAVKNVVERALNGERNRAITAVAAAKGKKDGSKLTQTERAELVKVLDAAGMLPEATEVKKEDIRVELVK